jgi:hypothetical protein
MTTKTVDDTPLPADQLEGIPEELKRQRTPESDSKVAVHVEAAKRPKAPKLKAPVKKVEGQVALDRPAPKKPKKAKSKKPTKSVDATPKARVEKSIPKGVTKKPSTKRAPKSELGEKTLEAVKMAKRSQGCTRAELDVKPDGSGIRHGGIAYWTKTFTSAPERLNLKFKVGKRDDKPCFFISAK